MHFQSVHQPGSRSLAAIRFAAAGALFILVAAHVAPAAHAATQSVSGSTPVIPGTKPRGGTTVTQTQQGVTQPIPGLGQQTNPQGPVDPIASRGGSSLKPVPGRGVVDPVPDEGFAELPKPAPDRKAGRLPAPSPGGAVAELPKPVPEPDGGRVPGSLPIPGIGSSPMPDPEADSADRPGQPIDLGVSNLPRVPFDPRDEASTGSVPGLPRDPVGSLGSLPELPDPRSVDAEPGDPEIELVPPSLPPLPVPGLVGIDRDSPPGDESSKEATGAAPEPVGAPAAAPATAGPADPAPAEPAAADPVAEAPTDVAPGPEPPAGDAVAGEETGPATPIEPAADVEASDPPAAVASTDGQAPASTPVVPTAVPTPAVQPPATAADLAPPAGAPAELAVPPEPAAPATETDAGPGIPLALASVLAAALLLALGFALHALTGRSAGLGTTWRVLRGRRASATVPGTVSPFSAAPLVAQAAGGPPTVDGYDRAGGVSPAYQTHVSEVSPTPPPFVAGAAGGSAGGSSATGGLGGGKGGATLGKAVFSPSHTVIAPGDVSGVGDAPAAGDAGANGSSRVAKIEGRAGSSSVEFAERPTIGGGGQRGLTAVPGLPPGWSPDLATPEADATLVGDGTPQTPTWLPFVPVAERRDEVDRIAAACCPSCARTPQGQARYCGYCGKPLRVTAVH